MVIPVPSNGSGLHRSSPPGSCNRTWRARRGSRGRTRPGSSIPPPGSGAGVIALRRAVLNQSRPDDLTEAGDLVSGRPGRPREGAPRRLPPMEAELARRGSRDCEPAGVLLEGYVSERAAQRKEGFRLLCTDHRLVGLRPPDASSASSTSMAIRRRSARPAGSLSHFSTARSIWAAAEGSGRLLSATTARASQETDHASVVPGMGGGIVSVVHTNNSWCGPAPRPRRRADEIRVPGPYEGRRSRCESVQSVY